MITVFDEAAILSDNAIFGVLSPAKLRQLAFSSERVVSRGGEIIIRQGDEGEHGFLVLDGEVSVERTVDGETKELAKLGRGYVAGDHAMIAGGPYRVTVTARATTHVLRIHRDVLLQLLDGDKAAMREMIRVLAARKAEVEEALGLTFD